MSEQAQQPAQPTTDQWPVLPKPTEIAVRCAALADPTKKAEEMISGLLEKKITDEATGAFELIVPNDDIAAQVADFITYCNKALAAIERRRLEYTYEPRNFVTLLNREVTLYTDRIGKAKQTGSAALLKHEQKKRAAEEERRRMEKEKNDREALEAAQALQQQGNTEGANRVLEVAASAPAASRRSSRPVATVGAATGRKVGMRKTWNGTVANLDDLLRAILEGKVSKDGIEVSQAWLNRLATAHGKEETVYGVKVTFTESLA